MKFAFLGYGLEQNWDTMTKSEQDAMFEDCFTYDSKLLKDGYLVDDGAALRPSRTAKTLRWRNGKVIVSDGPFAETKEQLGGVGVLEARDLAQAVELMVNHPGLRYGATFEIRPINEESLQRLALSMAKWHGNTPAMDPKGVKFASLGYINETGFGSKSESDFDAMMKECIAFDEERVKNGQWLSGIGLQGSGAAKTMRAKAGTVVITDGPFAETKEHLGGLVVLAFKDLNGAVSTLSKHPALRFGVAIEIRPIDADINRLWEAKQGLASQIDG